MSELEIRALNRDDAPAWRDLRIAMLRDDPQGFFADLDQAHVRTIEQWRDAIPQQPDVLLGLFDGAKLVGSAGFYIEMLPKTAHKGTMWGVYLAPDYRGRGHALALVERLIEHARQHVDVLQTGASTAGAPTYHRAGFVTYGVERDAYRVAGVSLDNELMAIHFDREP